MLQRFRFAVLERDLLVGEAVGRLIESTSGFEQAGVWTGSEEALAAIRLATRKPDLVVLDAGLPDGAALSFLRAVKAFAEIRTLVLAGQHSAGEVAKLMRAGASAVFSKARGAEQLASVLRDVQAGLTWMDPMYSGGVVNGSGDISAAEVALSTREREILARVRGGLTNKAIAQQMGMSEPGVKAGLQRLFHKFKVSNRAQLVYRAGRA